MILMQDTDNVRVITSLIMIISLVKRKRFFKIYITRVKKPEMLYLPHYNNGGNCFGMTW